jgi:hypothetical protein
VVEATFTGRITGTDPPIAGVRIELGEETLRRIANVESGSNRIWIESSYVFRVKLPALLYGGPGARSNCLADWADFAGRFFDLVLYRFPAPESGFL